MQFLRSMFLVILLCTFSVSIYCNEVAMLPDDPPDNPSDDNTLNDMYAKAIKQINTFFFRTAKDSDSLSAEENVKLNQHFKIGQSCNCKQLNECNIKEAIFYKRMVALLLSNLMIRGQDDKIIGTLNMEATFSQYKYLQNFVEGEGSIKDVDKILENVIKEPNHILPYYIAVEISYYTNILLTNILKLIPYIIMFLTDRWDIPLILIVILYSVVKIRNRGLTHRGVLLLLAEIVAISSFYMFWWQLLQKEQIKVMAAQAKYAEMPISCQPDKMTLWNKFVVDFSRLVLGTEDDCLKYHEAFLTDPRLQVTPAHIIMQFLSTIIFQPLLYFGDVFSQFIHNATSRMNIWYAFPITIIICLTFCICIIIVPLCFIGGSFDFGIGPVFRFAINGRRRQVQQERIDRLHEKAHTHIKKCNKELNFEYGDTNILNSLKNAHRRIFYGSDDTQHDVLFLSKRIKDTERMKQITHEQDSDNSYASINTSHSDEAEITEAKKEEKPKQLRDLKKRKQTPTLVQDSDNGYTTADVCHPEEITKNNEKKERKEQLEVSEEMKPKFALAEVLREQDPAGGDAGCTVHRRHTFLLEEITKFDERKEQDSDC